MAQEVWNEPELLTALNLALATLPPRQLQAITLWADGYSRREIAGIMDTSPNTVKNHIRIAIAKLRFQFDVSTFDGLLR